jgi:hypothetical protein
MRLYEFTIKENSRADLYHGTSLQNAEKIISGDILIARTPLHIGNSDQLTVSLSRNIQSAAKFAGDYYSSYPTVGVILVIDQGKLKQLVGKRMKPYDDTGTEYYHNQLRRYDMPTDKVKPLRSIGTTENEEVVMGDIVGINKCIKQIIILNSTDGDNAHKVASIIKNSSLLNDPRTVIGSLYAKFRSPINTLRKISP